MIATLLAIAAHAAPCVDAITDEPHETVTYDAAGDAAARAAGAASAWEAARTALIATLETR